MLCIQYVVVPVHNLPVIVNLFTDIMQNIPVSHIRFIVDTKSLSSAVIFVSLITAVYLSSAFVVAQ